MTKKKIARRVREFDFMNEAERTTAIKSARVRDIRFKNQRHGELSSTGGTPLYKTANRERFSETSRTRDSASNSKEGPFFRRPRIVSGCANGRAI